MLRSFSKPVVRKPAFSFAIVSAILLAVSLAAQERTSSLPALQFSQNGSSRAEAEESGKRRIREGTTLVEVGGYFRQDGEGATFVSEDQQELGALPNLNLERIVRTLKSSDEAESIRWSVNGTVTEFNGRNYLLISRAIYKSSMPPPLPEQVSN